MKKVILLFLCALALHRFCYQETDGFALSKIHSSLKPHPEWETDCPEALCKIVQQPFYYLGHGAQTFAFVSEDQQYVLKFYRHNRAGHPLDPLSFLLPTYWKNRLEKTVEKRQCKRLKDFSSYKLAYDQLRDETGLLCVHLNKTNNLHLKTILYDKIGVRHRIDLDQMEFLLQKKAHLLYPALEEWIAHCDFEQAEAALTSLVDLLRSRCQKGIFDKDADLKTNFGLIDATPIQFDIGRFKPDETRSDPKVYREDLFRITDALCQWLETKAPHLSAHIQQEIEK